MTRIAVPRRALIAVGLVLVLAVAVLGYIRVHRFDGGPLNDPSFGGGSGDIRVGRPIGFTDIYLNNKGGKEITLERVAARHVRRGTTVRMWAVSPAQLEAAERGSGGRLDRAPLVNGDPFPAHARFLRKISDFRIAPHARNVRLIAEVVATRPGCAGFNGLDIDYRAGSKHYRRTAHDLFYYARTPGVRGCAAPR